MYTCAQSLANTSVDILLALETNITFIKSTNNFNPVSIILEVFLIYLFFINLYNNYNYAYIPDGKQCVFPNKNCEEMLIKLS